ncbi:MAG: hypothetical protein MR025_00540 [Helicobacter trogontum]|uniref:hypothetical protein n=1 Tax=Helicobacter trogontum TaxID=50960 RepID=UPI00242ED9C0|nr:hypothetical protein [Helicobacter trogontum]MCI5785933.1 hypothetical protein [Helicobacter trogontum]
MYNTDIKFIYTQADLFKKIQEYSENAKTIQFYCTNFESYYRNRITGLFEDQLLKHLLSLAQRINIEVFSYNSLDVENIITQSSQKTYYLKHNLKTSNTPINNSICVHNMQTAQSSILFDFVKSLYDKVSNKNIKSLSEAIDEFIKQNNSHEALMNSIDEKLKKTFIQKVKQLSELEYLNNMQDLENSLKIIFDELNQSIQKIYKDGNSQMYKEIVNFFFSIVDIFSIKKVFTRGNPLLFGATTLFEGGKTLSNISEWADSKYSYAILGSILKPLTQDIAPLITLFENYALHTTLIIDNAILIDFSGLSIQTHELSTTLKQDLGICLQLKNQTLPSFRDNTNLVFHSKKANNTISICGKGEIRKFLQYQLSVSSNRFAYIESPFFNSTELVKLIKEKEEQNKKETDASKQGFNYLIISNAPYKHNAGLSTTLINKLNNKISYGNQSHKKITSDMLHPKPDKDYNTVVDYSKYQITINATKKEAYVLSLSPFVHIDKEKYKEYTSLYREYFALTQAPKSRELTAVQHLVFVYNADEMQKVASYQYIQSFFKQPKDKQEIIEKEEQYFQESIACLQGYINSIIKTKDIKHRMLTGLSYETEIKKCSYSALDVLLLALSYYLIKNFYGGVKTDPQWFLWNYEYIKVSGESIDMLPTASYIETLDGNLPLCFSIKQKEKNDQIFCIEEFVLTIEQSEQNQNLSDQEQQMLNMLFTHIESNNDSKENDAIFKDIENNLHDIDNKLSQIKQQQEQQTQINNQKILEEILKNFITAYFPFSSVFFNLSGIDIIHKLTKTLLKLSFSKKLSTSLVEEFGLLYIATILNSKDKTLYATALKGKESRANTKLKQIKKKAFIQLARIHRTQAFEVIALGDITNNSGMKSLEDTLRKRYQKEKQYANIKDKQKREAAIQKAINKEIIKQKGLFAKEFITDTFKDFIKGLPQAIALNIFNQVFVTEYEKSKKEFERLQFTKLNYKYDYPYALKRDGGVYYPMMVYNTFLSFNLHNMIIGGKLKTGGLGVLDALFYHLNNASSKQVPNYLLQKLLGYILLDELRGVSRDTNYYINDIDFFANGTNAASLDILQNKKELYKLRDDKKLQEFKKLDENEEEKAIDCYNTCIDILSDFANGNINTNAKANTYHAKYRELLEKLNIIGHNNIKAMYYGLSGEEKGKKPPKAIGRLAITIIMEDGLWIG